MAATQLELTWERNQLEHRTSGVACSDERRSQMETQVIRLSQTQIFRNSWQPKKFGFCILLGLFLASGICLLDLSSRPPGSQKICLLDLSSRPPGSQIFCILGPKCTALLGGFLHQKPLLFRQVTFGSGTHSGLVNLLLRLLLPRVWFCQSCSLISCSVTSSSGFITPSVRLLYQESGSVSLVLFWNSLWFCQYFVQILVVKFLFC